MTADPATTACGDRGPIVRWAGNAVAAMWARLYRAAEPVQAGSEGALDAAGLREVTLGWERDAATAELGFALLADQAVGRSPAGFVACAPWDRRWSRRGMIGNINALWVEPRMRGFGIGHALAQSVITELRRCGPQVLEVQALGSNPSGQAFWQRQGSLQKATLFRAPDV